MAMHGTGRQDREQDGPSRDSSALVVVDGGAPRQDGTGGADATAFRGRADAAFLAHLLAVRTHAPDQRAKRRAAPEVGAAAYRTGLALLVAPRRARGIEA